MNALKKERIAQELTQDMLASVSGVSRATIARIETGSIPSVRTMKRLAKALKVDWTQLCDDREENAHENDARP